MGDIVDILAGLFRAGGTGPAGPALAGPILCNYGLFHMQICFWPDQLPLWPDQLPFWPDQ